MKFRAKIDVLPKEELLDPQGKAILKNLHQIGVDTAIDMRVGKHIKMDFEANSESEAEATVKRACDKLLINPIMEYYQFELEAIA